MDCTEQNLLNFYIRTAKGSSRNLRLVRGQSPSHITRRSGREIWLFALQTSVQASVAEVDLDVGTGGRWLAGKHSELHHAEVVVKVLQGKTRKCCRSCRNALPCLLPSTHPRSLRMKRLAPLERVRSRRSRQTDFSRPDRVDPR